MQIEDENAVALVLAPEVRKCMGYIATDRAARLQAFEAAGWILVRELIRQPNRDAIHRLAEFDARIKKLKKTYDL